MNKKEQRLKRAKRVRRKLRGTKDQPRLSVFRSNRFVYVQVIDDDARKTILSVSERELNKSSTSFSRSIDSREKNNNTNQDGKSSNPEVSQTEGPRGFEKVRDKDVKNIGKIELARKVGVLVAKRALEKKIKKAVFDRSGYAYHGRIKAVAEGAREGGLQL